MEVLSRRCRVPIVINNGVPGIITLQMIFRKYWEAFKKWHTGTIRAAVISNVEKILKCRTGQLGFHAYKCPKCKDTPLLITIGR